MRYWPCVVAAMVLLCACAGNKAPAARGEVPAGARVLNYDYAGGRNVRTLAIGSGIACQADGTLGPMTFRAADAGRRGVPALTGTERSTLLRIEHYVHSSTLRFAWLGGEFIVYQATDGVCTGSVYWVMNGACNEFYSPTDTSIDYTVPGGGCWNTPPPWKRDHS